MTARGVGAVLGRIAGGLFQQAWIVEDRDLAEEMMRRSFGCERFVEFEMDAEWELRGHTVNCALSLAFARSGNMQIELMQPLRGEGIHVEFLARHGPGAHHLGFLVDDLDATEAAAADDGVVKAMTGAFGGMRLCYLDTLDSLGVYLELIEDPAGLLQRVMPWRDDQVTNS
jgi:hypothetical protein